MAEIDLQQRRRLLEGEEVINSMVLIDDSEWPEVYRINSYSTLLGWLWVATGGIGLLVLTWTTVVLLGGFVSVLHKKDFWSLTVITLMEVAGAASSFIGERIDSVALSPVGIIVVNDLNVWEPVLLSEEEQSLGSVLLMVVKLFFGTIAVIVQLVVFIIALVVFAFITCGLFISTLIAMWRLTEHDYGTGDGSDPNKANMSSALDVLYILVVVQGAIHVYRLIMRVAASKHLVAQVAEEYGFQGPAVEIVESYMKIIRNGCSTDPSFANEKNLVTVGVDLLGHDKQPSHYRFGLRILSTLLGSSSSVDKFSQQRTLIKQLIVMHMSPSSSSGGILEKMLRTSSPRRSNPYDRELIVQINNESELDKKARERAARIVIHVADEAHLEQIPQVIQCISSMIGTFEEYHQQTFCSDNEYSREEEEKGYKELLVQGLHVLSVLAADENSCRVISDTRGLLTKIMAPLTSGFLHLADHDAWGHIVEESLRVLRQLTAAPGETGAKLRREISINNEAISGMEMIVECNHCNAKLHELAMRILTKLHMHSESKEYFVKMLDIFTNDNMGSSMTNLAVEALAMLCSQDGSKSTTILQVNAAAVDRLTLELAAFENGYQRHMISAAQILEHLCIHYTEKDEHLEKLKTAMADLMPKVLSKILPGDIVDQQGSASQDNSRNRSSSSRQESQEQRDNRVTEAALLSLCVTVCDTFISEDQHLAPHFDAVSLPSKLRGMVERNSDPTVSCLKILKLASKMVISMMKHSDNIYLKKDMESLLVALLGAYSGNMSLVNSSMVFASGDDDGAMTTKKPQRTLKSLVDEASELVHSYKPQEE